MESEIKELRERERYVAKMEREKEGYRRKLEDAIAEKRKIMTEYDRTFQENEHQIQKQAEVIEIYKVQQEQLTMEVLRLDNIDELERHLVNIKRRSEAQRTDEYCKENSGEMVNIVSQRQWPVLSRITEEGDVLL